jgi:hypothetical protein
MGVYGVYEYRSDHDAPALRLMSCAALGKRHHSTVG